MEKTKEEILRAIYGVPDNMHLSVCQATGSVPDFEPIYRAMDRWFNQQTTSQSSVIKEQAERIEKLEAALREIEASCDNANDSHEQIWSIAANALIK